MNLYIVKDSIDDGFADNVLWLANGSPVDLDTAIKKAREIKKQHAKAGGLLFNRVKIVRVDV